MALLSLKITPAITPAGGSVSVSSAVKSVAVSVPKTIGLVLQPSPQPVGSTASTSVTYYVKTGGNDANDGLTPATAWLTVAKVNAATLNPGDTVRFNGGDTFSGAILTPPASGTRVAPIMFSSYGTGRATITLGLFVLKDWIVIDYLTFPTSCQFGSAISVVTANHIVFQNNTIPITGANSSVGLLTYGNHYEIIDNTISGTGDSGMLLGQASGGTANGWDSEDYLIENNTITNTGTNNALGFGTHGIYCKVKDARIRGNTITYFYSSAISIRYPNALVTNNFLQYSTSGAGNGIGVNWFQYDTVATGTTRILNNAVLDVGLPIYVSPSDVGGNTRESFVITGNVLRQAAVTKATKALDLAATTGTYVVGHNPLHSTSTNNAFVNGSFETAPSTEWNTGSGFSISSGATLTQDATFATIAVPGGTQAIDGGTHSGKLVCSGANSHKGIEQTLTLTAAGSYTATCFVRGNAGGELLDLVAAGSGQAVTRSFTATTSWVQYSVSFYYDGTNGVNIAVRTQSTANPTFFVDFFIAPTA